MDFFKFFKSRKFREAAPKYALIAGTALFGFCMFSDVGNSLKNVTMSELTENTPLHQASEDVEAAKKAVSVVGSEAGADKFIERAKKEIENDSAEDDYYESWYEEIEEEIESDNIDDETGPVISVQSSDKTENTQKTIDLLSLQECLVARVVDGDTYVLDIEGVETKVRLIGIDTPESVAPESYYKNNTQEGKTVSDIVKEKLQEGSLLYLEYDVSPTDKYGRTLAYLYFPDGTMVQEWLLNEGLANVATYPPNVKYADYFAELAHTAAENKVGLWENFFTEAEQGVSE